MNDDELATKLKTVAKKWNYSPEAALSLLDAALQQNAIMVTPNFGPYPKLAEEYILPNRLFLGLPAWTEELIPANAKIEKYIFPDGRAVAKLITDRGLVLLAKEL